jgi:hypothetical protein
LGALSNGLRKWNNTHGKSPIGISKKIARSCLEFSELELPVDEPARDVERSEPLKAIRAKLNETYHGRVKELDLKYVNASFDERSSHIWAALWDNLISVFFLQRRRVSERQN